MNDYAQHVRGFAYLQAKLGSDCPSISWNIQDWPIIPGTARRRKDLSPQGGGFQLNADFSFNALLSTFLTDTITTFATLKDKMLQSEIGYAGDLYKAMTMDLLPGGLIITVGCNSEVEGA